MSFDPQRSRAGSALAGGVAVLASAWPLTPLFASGRWLFAAALTLGVAAAVGALTRGAGCHRATVPPLQALTLAGALALTFAAPTLAFGVVPTGATFGLLAATYAAGIDAVQANSIPVPASPGLDLVLTSSVAMLGLVVDAVAVTLRRPTLAGLIVALPYLVAVANTDAPLPTLPLVVMSAGWLVLLAASNPSQASPPHGRRTRRRLCGLSAAAALGVVAIVGGIVVAGAIPRASHRVLPGARAKAGQVGYSPDADLLRDLRSSDTTPVFTYRTDDPTPEPIRVTSTSTYLDGRWSAQPVSVFPSDRPGLVHTPRLPDDVPSRPRVFTVEANRLRAPAAASPGPILRGSVTNARWAMDARTGALTVDVTPAEYSMTYLDLEPTRAQLAGTGPVPLQLLDPETLDTSGASPQVVETAARVAGAAPTPYARAMALQAWLRDTGGFTYSLDLAEPPSDMPTDEQARSTLDRFLETKRGYCVQFATAMTLMARSLDIPARYVTGFLPGRSTGDAHEVVAADAHAWPELYFDGIGWLRFEPTPGARSGTPPPYASPTASAPTTPTPRPSTATVTPRATPSPQPRPTRAPAGGDPDAVPSVGGSDRGVLWWSVPVVLAGVFGILPLLARRARRRDASEPRSLVAGNAAATRARDAELVERRWQHLLDRVADLDVRPTPAHPPARQAEDIAHAAGLDRDGRADLHRIGVDVEAARYGHRPVRPWPVDAEARALAALRRTRSRRQRLRAALWPVAGRRELARLVRARNVSRSGG